MFTGTLKTFYWSYSTKLMVMPLLLLGVAFMSIAWIW